MDIIILVVTGIIAGVFTGLLGSSAGIIIVPVLLLLFQRMGVNDHVLSYLVVGTTLACCWVAILSSAWSHRKDIVLNKYLLVVMLVNPIVSLVLLHFILPFLTGHLFKILFALLLLGLPLLTMIRKSKSQPANRWRNNIVVIFFAGILNGLGMAFGSGGGVLLLPYFRALGFNMKMVMGHLVLAGVPSVLAFVIFYMYSGWGKSLPNLSAGYVYFPALLYVGVPAMVCAKFATHFRHKMPESGLRFIFNVTVILIGVSMLVHNF